MNWKNTNHKFMLRTSFILTFCFISCCALAQYKNFNTEENIWREGVIKLEDGEVIEAELNFNFVSGVLKARTTEGETGIIYSPIKVLYFEFNEGDKKALFYSLPYDFEGRGYYKPTFFEEIYRIGDNVILSRHDFEYKEKPLGSANDHEDRQIGSANNQLGRVDPVTMMLRNEKVHRIIYLAANGEIHPILQGRVDKAVSVIFEEGFSNNKRREYHVNDKLKKSNTQIEKVKYKSILKKDLGEVFPEEYYEIKGFIKDNKIDLDEVEGWKSIIDYKNQLTK